MDAVVSSATTNDLMSGLPSQGYEGLALWPEALRHPYSFGAPILTLSDFYDISIRAPVSNVIIRPAEGAWCDAARPRRRSRG